MRDSTSVGPPAGKRLIYLTGLFGQSSAARARPEPIIGAASAPPDSNSARRRGNMSFFNAGLPYASLRVKPSLQERIG
jgi:hypothetical protein